MAELAALEAAPAAAAGGAAIVGRGVGKQFATKHGPFTALDAVSFDIRGGEFVSLIGPSGCGKSTLMLITAGLIPASGGELHIGGERLQRPLTDVGIVFQDHLLLEFRSALDNVLLQAQIRGLPVGPARAHAAQILDKLGIPELARGRYPRQLSGGMRQRVSIARALIHQPSILLMDEPFGALDAITRTQIRHDLELLWMETRKTVLFITHSIEEAIGLSDRVLVMSPNPGRIVDEIAIELPRPRPAVLGEDASFNVYAERIHRAFRRMGVIKY
ncbi:MAG: ABC transporter ATP-binding protein [Casimicrobiaceae bacterium]